MAKPSIFSKDYERRMKKRRKSIILFVLFIVVIIGVLIYNSSTKNIDFSNLRAKIQAWVDSGKTEKSSNGEEENTKKSEKELPNEKTKEPEKLYVNLNVSTGVVIKAEYEEKDGKKQFVSVVDPVQGYTFNISPSKGQLLILDSAQNMKIATVDGTVKDITKTVYVSQSGTNFNKDEILQNNPTYIWHSQAKFIDDNKVIYVSQLPYFKKGAKKYIWMYDLSNGSDNIVWELVGANITVGDVTPDKGITVTVDGEISYLKADETISK